ncbi:hypothetical protein Van01_38120 [Micromonospora andamanensis]|uniref:Uncharacterized protein n=1 Tax=Micromonospora andamanensis TaxID=1287068 RepID=A0ABQ4HY52_9ACTN|nr:hypothetical protein Van01_38120 [Micromonospora andamanensis]
MPGDVDDEDDGHQQQRFERQPEHRQRHRHRREQPDHPPPPPDPAGHRRSHRRRQQHPARARGEDQTQLRRYAVEIIAGEPVAVKQQHRQSQNPEQQPEPRLSPHRVRGAARPPQVAYPVGHAADHRNRLSREARAMRQGTVRT